MEIPVINRISDSLENPSLLSQSVELSGFGKIYATYGLWKWGALILGLVASLSTIISRLKILIIWFKRDRSLQSHSEPLLQEPDYDSDTDSSCVSSEDEREEYDEPSTSRSWRQVDDDFRVRGSGYFTDDQWQNRKITLRKRRSSLEDLFSWDEEQTSGKSVVKLWDNLGLGFGFDLGESDTVLSVYDVSKGRKLTSMVGGKTGFQAFSAPSSSPLVVLSAGADSSSGRVAVGAWDSRLSCRIPAILSEWMPKKSVERITAVNAEGIEKVYIRDDDETGKLTVG